MQKSHLGVAVLGIVVGAASMVVVYASGMAQPWTALPQTATVTLQNRWDNRKTDETSAPRAGETFDYSQLEKLYTLLQNQYYDQAALDTGVMFDGALKWFVAALGDPYTVFLDTEENSSFTEELKGEENFEGIGAAILKKNDAIEIQEVYKWTPSYEAGLRPLDLIVEVNGEKTTEMTTQDAVDKIRGPEGSSVELAILRQSAEDPAERLFKVDITRKKVSIPSVSTDLLTMGTRKIGYINISIIGEQTENAMKKAVAEVKAQNIDGLILDLRGNGGGFLDIGVEIASHFVPKGQTVVTTKYRVAQYDEIYQSQWYAEFDSTPVVVLVDFLTASAGEIIAAALRDINGAVIVGTQTFGKWSIQTIEDFGVGSAIKYTIGKWYTPNDENIDEVGLTPDVVVDFDADAYKSDGTDNQLERAKEEVIKLIN